jgi:pectin methylesterase-like acyl-CoA thioesterase
VCKQACEHKVINSAVAAAASGDTVSIGPGTYFENVVISNKNLTVTGYSEDYTVIDGGFQGATLSISVARPVRIRSTSSSSL